MNEHTERARVACVTLGCPKNQVDSEAMLGILHRRGYRTAALADAEVAIVNTCSFIEPARQESIEAILEVARHKRDGPLRRVIVAGCLAQRYGEELLEEMPEVDGVIGTGALGEIAELLAELEQGTQAAPRLGTPGAPLETLGGRVLSTPRHYAYLKISEGCDHRCAFCIIPALRGGMRSRPVEELLAEAERLVEGGVREIELIAQDTTAYGSDLDGGRGELRRLLGGLGEITGLRWVRLLYTHPALWSDTLVAAVGALGTRVPYVDVPIQHVSDRMMERMNRGITGRRVRRTLDGLRKRLPAVALRSTVIVGHPGETESDVRELVSFLSDFRFERLGVFPYSREEGTPAGIDPEQVKQPVVEDRLARVVEVAREVALELHGRRLGSTIEVMLDGAPRDGRMPARSAWDAPEIDGAVWVRGATGSPGDMMEVDVVGGGPHDVAAVPAG